MPSWYSVQFAGWVITTRSAGPPICSATAAVAHWAIRAVSRSAWYGEPDSISGTGSPTRALELAGESLRLRRAVTLGRTAEQQLVAGGEDDGRDRDRVGGQRDDFDDAVAADGRGGERGPHVDPEVIRHASLLPSGAAS